MLSHLQRIKRPRLATPINGYTAAQLARRYGFPSVTSSKEQVAIIELGGGYSPSDVQAYCQGVGCHVPIIQSVSVDGASNSYTGDPNSADGEVALDIQNVIGATGGMCGIRVYWAQNTSASFAKAIRQVAIDGFACACSISWGQAESGWSATDRALMDSAFQACAQAGVSCFAASGDDGSSDGTRGQAVDYPASSPWCMGCGGTTITNAGETAWSYGGGGMSSAYQRPTWQLASGNGRGVPDVSMDADPNSGYVVVLGGQPFTFGGTSAVAPMWAALTALWVTITGQRLGFFAPTLYQLENLFTDIISGKNGAYQAVKGYDYCTGLGVPNATLSKAMTAQVAPPVNPPTQPPPVVNHGVLTLTIDTVAKTVVLPPGYTVTVPAGASIRLSGRIDPR